MDLDPEIAAHYAGGAEQSRLLAGHGELERIRTQELLTRYLPPPPSTILDVGGAAGAYALPLAAAGHRVWLVDPLPLHVERALAASARQPEAPLAGAALGEARCLVQADRSVDAVLLLGPLYHLIAREERLAALREARRVLRPGGVLVAAAISRFASTYSGLLHGFLAEEGFEAIVDRDVADGQHRNPGRDPRWFTTAFFHLPRELASEVRAAGLNLDALVAVEGPGLVTPDLDAWLADPRQRQLLLDAIRRVESEPSLLGASAHFMAVATCPPS